MTQNKTIHLCIAHMSETGEEMKYINRAFDEHWVAPLGPNVDGFEEDSDYLVMHLYTYGKSQLKGWLFCFWALGLLTLDDYDSSAPGQMVISDEMTMP